MVDDNALCRLDRRALRCLTPHVVRHQPGSPKPLSTVPVLWTVVHAMATRTGQCGSNNTIVIITQTPAQVSAERKITQFSISSYLMQRIADDM
jgi:hypothetical protein